MPDSECKLTQSSMLSSSFAPALRILSPMPDSECKLTQSLMARKFISPLYTSVEEEPGLADACFKMVGKLLTLKRAATSFSVSGTNPNFTVLRKNGFAGERFENSRGRFLVGKEQDLGLSGLRCEECVDVLGRDLHAVVHNKLGDLSSNGLRFHLSLVGEGWDGI